MTIQQTKAPRIAIIGAGLTGLITATLLERAYANTNRQPTIDIFEKSAGVGRLATRYKTPQDLSDNLGNKTTKKQTASKQWQFDFGAQFFTAKSASFNEFIRPWIQSGVLVPWQANVSHIITDEQMHTKFIEDAAIQDHWGDAQPRYISTPKMTSWGRQIAKALRIAKLHYKTRVTALNTQSYKEGVTTLINENGDLLGEFDWVICTAPCEQTIELFERTKFSHNEVIKRFKMQACYSLMLGWRTVEQLPSDLKNAKWDVALSKSTQHKNILGKLFLEHHKPGRDHLLPSVTLHASNEWSEAHVDDDIETVTQTLVQSVGQLLDWQAHEYPDHIDCHRWRYAATNQAFAQTLNDDTSTDAFDGAFIDNQHHWIVAGDWCVEGRIESCFESATEAVNSIKPL